jgi:hypothetical protein
VFKVKAVHKHYRHLHCFLILYSFSLVLQPSAAMAPSFTRLLEHTQRCATVGRTPLGRVMSSSQCCIVLPACIVLLFYCNQLIDLYRHMLIFCWCNCRVYIMQVRRVVLRIRCMHMLLMLSFSLGGFFFFFCSCRAGEFPHCNALQPIV